VSVAQLARDLRVRMGNAERLEQGTHLSLLQLRKRRWSGSLLLSILPKRHGSCVWLTSSSVVAVIIIASGRPRLYARNGSPNHYARSKRRNATHALGDFEHLRSDESGFQRRLPILPQHVDHFKEVG